MDNNVAINGSGSISQGDYDNITINGSATLNGCITAKKVSVFGGATANSLTTEEMRVSGAATINDMAKIGTLEVSGSVKFKNVADIENVKCSGAISFQEDANITMLSCTGTIKCPKAITSTNFDIIGGGSNIHKIKSLIVSIKPSKLTFFMKNNVIDTITAKTINISRCDVSTIIGEDVFIGPKCYIDSVTYKETLTIDKSSTVKNIVQN